MVIRALRATKFRDLMRTFFFGSLKDAKHPELRTVRLGIYYRVGACAIPTKKLPWRHSYVIQKRCDFCMMDWWFNHWSKILVGHLSADRLLCVGIPWFAPSFGQVSTSALFLGLHCSWSCLTRKCSMCSLTHSSFVDTWWSQTSCVHTYGGR
jgi:hypothetical protein